jgi:hypothetical protein
VPFLSAAGRRVGSAILLDGDLRQNCSCVTEFGYGPKEVKGGGFVAGRGAPEDGCQIAEMPPSRQRRKLVGISRCHLAGEG